MRKKFSRKKLRNSRLICGSCGSAWKPARALTFWAGLLGREIAAASTSFGGRACRPESCY